MVSGRAVERGLLAAVSACFALGFGLNYGKSNQSTYLLSSLKSLEPELWTRDWLVGTQHYHPAYAALATLLLKLDDSGWLLGLANIAAACVAAWCIQRLVLALVSGRAALPAFLLVLALCASSGTNGPGGSYVLSDVFQPSTLGALGLLGAALSFVKQRAWLSGVWLAFAGAFHLNYLVLGLCVFAVAWWLEGRGLGLGQRLRLLGLGLGPACLVLLWFLPLLRASGDSSLAEEARRLIQDVRAPHHYKVATFPRAFLPWVGFQLLGAAALWPSRHQAGPERRLLSLLVGFWLLVVPASLLSGAGLSRAISQLFAWRLAPHATLLAQVGLGCAVVRHLLAPAAPEAKGRVPTWLGGLGLCCLLLAAVLGVQPGTALLGLALVGVTLLVERYRQRLSERATAWQSRWLLELAAVLCFGVASASALAHLNTGSDLLAGKDQDAERLCSWVRGNTAQNALLLTPPEEGELRFRCRRAIVVDWKSTPVIPAEVLQWSKRIEDVTGRHPLRGQQDLAGYGELDAQRLEQLRAKYGFDLAVVGRSSALARQRKPDFVSGRFLAYRLH